MFRRIRKVFAGTIPTIVKTGILAAVPSLYGVLEIRPSSCNILLTNRCNLKCVMCGQWREKPREELSTADWKKIIDDIRKNGFRNIHFTGGEPLLRDDLKDLISYSVARGFTVGMTTNGMLLDVGSLRGLIEAGLRSVALSIDALGEEYEKIRGVSGSFTKLKAAAIAVAEAKKLRGIDAYVNFTLMNNNIKLFRKVKEFSDTIGLPVAVCLLDKTSSIFNLKDNENRFWIESAEDSKRLALLLEYMKDEIARLPHSLILNYQGIEFIAAYFNDPHQGYIHCVISQDRIYVDPYGNVFGGCLSMGTFGNLEEMPFSSLKNTDRYKNAKKNMFYKKCKGCSCGYLFNIRHTPSLILKNIVLNVRTALKG